MVLPLLALGAGVMAGGAAAGLLGKKSTPKIDITQQLQQLQDTYAKNRQVNAGLTDKLNPITNQYKTDLQSMLAGQKTDFTGNKNEFLTSTDNNTKEAQDALRKNLYGSTFNALPDTLQAVREASAAGGGLKTGSYQKAVNDVGRTTAQTIAQGEGNLQAQGAQMKQGAQETAFNAFNNLSNKLSDEQMQGLVKVMDTGREDLIRQYTTEMGLNQDEAQGIIDLLNFKQTGQQAASTADEANRMALINAIMGAGGKIAGAGAGK